MAETLTPQELLKFIQGMNKGIVSVFNRTLLRVMPKAELMAKQNVKKNFPGRRGYRLTGGLLNSISHAFRTGTNGYLSGVLKSSGIAYNQIHEFGGTIKPKQANHLWIKNHRANSKYRTLTPREFVQKMRSQTAGDIEKFIIRRSKNNKLTAQAFINGRYEDSLFYLRDQVKIPERPYLRPAMESAKKEFDSIFSAEFDKEGNK